MNIASSVRRLFPNQTPEQAMVELLLERAQKNLIKYETAARQFQVIYGISFSAFRKKVAAGEVSADEEQDYFDWELAMTGIDDMCAEIKRLKAMNKKA